jgi:hypothetical protein
MLDKIKYFLRRKKTQFRNLKRWFPIIWNKYDFDYGYTIEIFKRSLTDQAEFLESDNAYSLDAKKTAKKIREIIDLMNKVYDEEFALEYHDELKKLYGDNVLDFRFEPVGDGSDSSYLKHEYEMWDNADEVDKVFRELLNKSRHKQEKKHAELWQMVEENIQSLWD